jgi:hypothetical protein
MFSARARCLPDEVVGYARLKELVDESYLGGKSWMTAFRKIPPASSIQGTVVDFSMAPGTPRANYYTGDELTATLFSLTRSIWAGANVLPATKHLHKVSILSSTAGVVPCWFTLCDYLLFYPLVDMDNTDEDGQVMVNTVTLPRYTDGEGVQIMVVATNPYIGGGTFFVEYTNSRGESGRMSRIMTSNISTSIGTVIHSGTSANVSGTFVNLAPGDSGVRSVQKITFLTGNGGLAVVALVKPIANIWDREAGCFSEWDFLTMKPSLPRIMDGACLNFIGAVNGTAVGVTIMGELSVIWN